jgi:SPP1 gp7 family putative phage head morphogenesis protein
MPPSWQILDGPSTRLYMNYVRKLTNDQLKSRLAILRELQTSTNDIVTPEEVNRLLANFIPDNNMVFPSMGRLEVIGAPLARSSVREVYRLLKQANMPPRVLRSILPNGPINTIDLFESGLGREELSSWSKEGVDLIKTAMVENKNDLITGIVDTARLGKRWEDLAGEIQRTTGILQSRAELIAQDQVAKLNGQITQSLQLKAGVTSYEWVTVGDERVRESHRRVNGMEFSWDVGAPNVGFYGTSGHPGQCGRCRCRARPIAPDWWKNL